MFNSLRTVIFLCTSLLLSTADGSLQQGVGSAGSLQRGTCMEGLTIRQILGGIRSSLRLVLKNVPKTGTPLRKVNLGGYPDTSGAALRHQACCYQGSLEAGTRVIPFPIGKFVDEEGCGAAVEL